MGYISKKVAAYGQFVLVFFIGASAIRSRKFRYGLPKNIWSKGQKTKVGWAYSAPLPTD